MKKKGFTLVELLAVIVILGIILLITVPKITSTVNKSVLASMGSSAQMIAANAEREYVNRTILETLDQNNNPIQCSDVVKLSTDDYSGCTIDFDTNGVAKVTLIGKGKFQDMYCNNATRNTMNCTNSKNVYSESILNGAYPRITEGMIPVTIADNGTVTTIDESNSNWYSYTNKKWANVVLVKESGTQTRSYYQNNRNVTVSESDILAYLVWIPRYRYTLWNVTGNAATYTGGCSNASYLSPSTCVANSGTWTTPTCTSNCPQSINITFENANTTKSTGSTNGTQLTHPGFTYNNTELNGIWVGKFETTQGTALNVGTTNPTIKPNITSWRNQNVSTQFNTSLLFSTNTIYGLTGESRMSKNSDWGVITYLSHSQYGINTMIRLNNNLNYITGCGATIADGASTATCEIAYGSNVASYPQSTTGNISGIFDMSGGAWEYQMGVYTNATNDKYSGLCNIYTSGYK